jgi:hypothetical protein
MIAIKKIFTEACLIMETENKQPQGFSKKTIFWIKERVFYVAWYTLLVSIVSYWALKHFILNLR